MVDDLVIRALKYPNVPHYEWPVALLEETSQYVICLGQPGRQLTHHTRQTVFTFDDYWVEFFSFEHWFTVSMGIEHGAACQYYCNIAMPATRDGNVVSFVDLDLDYVKRGWEEPWQVIDADEFEINAAKFGYAAELIRQAQVGLQDLESRVDECRFPFDGKLQSFIGRLNEWG